MSDDVILALDFGGTKLSAAAVAAGTAAAQEPVWLGEQRVFTPADADRDHEIAQMVQMAEALLDGRQLRTVGISFGGPANFDRGLVYRSDHVAGWENTPLQALLEARWRVPVRVDNDANAAALGEHRFGAGQGCQDLLYVTVSTGVGGGWVLDGRLWRGQRGMAGEIGHTVVDSDGPRCLCGKRGCVERLASGPFLAADALATLEAEPQRESTLRGRSVELTARDIAEAATQGDGLARALLLRSAWAVGVGLGNAANLIAPQRFILGGGVTKAGELWWQGVRQAAQETALSDLAFDIVPAALGDDAPLWGAVALVADL